MNHQTTFKPVRFFGRQGFVSIGRHSQKNIVLTFPGTNIPDPFSCVKATDRSARRLQRAATIVKRTTRKATPRRTRQRGAASRSSAASGDGNSDGESPRPQLYDQPTLAAFLAISKKTLQNRYSVAPHTLPPAISIPGARGPRWTPESVAEWLSSRPQHTTKTATVAPRRKAGRPRIAHAAKGGASC